MKYRYWPIHSGILGCTLKKPTLLFVVILHFIGLYTQAQPFLCRQFSANDGLPSSYCFTSFHDYQGYLWVGTYGGVGRFDGKTFTNFTVNNGLVNNQVISLFQDKDQNVWIGTFSGISIWKQGHFRTITTVGKVPIERVYGITQTSDGRIWATSDHGLLLFDHPGATPKLFQLDIQNQPVRRLWGVCQTPSGQLLVSNSTHLYLFEKNRFSEIKYPDGKSIEARCIVRIDNRVLIGTYEQGLFEYKSGTVQPLYSTVLPGQLRVFDVLKDNRQRLWLATNQGAMCIDRGKVTILNTLNYLPSDKCLGISKDTEGNIWITSPEGLIQCKERFIDVFTKADGLLNDEIYSLGKDKNGVIYFGGSNGPFSAYRGGTIFQPFPAFDATKSSGLPIHFTRFDQKGDLWISCDADGVFKLSRKRIVPITATGKFCSAFLEDTLHDAIWMGNREQLFRYQHGQWDTITPPPVMAVDNILALYQDKQSRIWIGTYGLRIFDGKTWTDLSKKTNTESVFIQSIKTDKAGAIWVGTIGKGIRKIRVDERGAIVSVETITTREGLQNDSVLDLEFDDEGQLWVGSFGGIMRINLNRPKEKGQYVSRVFNRTSGILDNTWQIVSFLKDNTGDIWAGTSTGAMRFNIRAIPTSSISPPVHIVSAQLLQNTHESPTHIQDIAANAVLPYYQNALNFQFTGISLSDPSGIRYTYKLDGLPEANWSVYYWTSTN